MSFLQSVGTSVPTDLIPYISTIVSGESQDYFSQIASVYIPLIIILVFYIAFAIVYCVKIPYKFPLYVRVFFLFMCILSLSMIINGNIRIATSYNDAFININKMVSIITTAFDPDSECTFFANSSEFSDITEQIDGVTDIIDNARESDYILYYVGVMHGISILLGGFSVSFLFVQSTTVVVFTFILTTLLLFVIIPVTRVVSFIGAVVCLPDVTENIISVLNTLNQTEIVEYYTKCEDNASVPEMLDVFPINASFFDILGNFGLECYENNTVYCSDTMICGGTSIPEEFDEICLCGDFLSEIESLLYECTRVNTLYTNLADETVCLGLVDAFSEVYISTILFIFSVEIFMIIKNK